MKSYLIVILFMVGYYPLTAQDNLLKELEEESAETTVKTESTFKGTRIINGHSVETRPKGVLEFIISHRFGDINSGSYEFFGLDQSNIRLGLEYGITDNLYIGVGRSSFEKTFDGLLKYRLMRQRSGLKPFPLSVTTFGSVTVKTLKTDEPNTFTDKLAYTGQLLIARKISDALSIQLMPSVIHFNTIAENDLTNTIWAAGAGGRMKLTKRLALNIEYYYQFDQLSEAYQNALAIGFDIETGGHVFQLHFTNSRAMIEKGFIAETTGDFFDGDIRFGFNITRAFQLKE